ncbi:hypothetical protein [Spiroplasma tabanidicola]|uniref:Uncharacterized protein n=1 Tax=Spiroplasma tabanidicola TaxID=324079 RepID=A0A6I6CAG3_9MOLU|nr:hypothetical protein [Spiroplasma tabanidicola]QGS52459.1 hypothetical protein STABA_v1c11120 [Spiroplasma tabanidicola]
MKNEKILSQDEHFKMNYDRIYFTKSISSCPHKYMSFDFNDGNYKCTNCFYSFYFNKKEAQKLFGKKILKNFDFDKAYKQYSDNILEKKRNEKISESLKDLYELY